MEGPNLALQYCSFPVVNVNEILRDNVTDSKPFSDADVENQQCSGSRQFPFGVSSVPSGRIAHVQS